MIKIFSLSESPGLPATSTQTAADNELNFVKLPLVLADGGADLKPHQVIGETDVTADVLRLLRGFDWLLAQNVDYIVLSLGPQERELPPTHPLSVALQTAVRTNTPVIVAAGNWGPEPDTLQAFARVPGVIAIGATDRSGELLERSSRGQRGGAEPAFVCDGETERIFGVPDFEAGTSFAAARAAGLLPTYLGSLRILLQEFSDHFDNSWSIFSRPVHRPVVGMADTGTRANQISQDKEMATWQGGRSIQFTHGEQDRKWIARLHEGLGALGVRCVLRVTPKIVGRAMRQSASPVVGRESWEVGSGLVGDDQARAWLGSFTTSNFVDLFASSPLDAKQAEGVAALNAELSPKWNDSVADYLFALFAYNELVAMAKVM